MNRRSRPHWLRFIILHYRLGWAIERLDYPKACYFMQELRKEKRAIDKLMNDDTEAVEYFWIR